MKRIVFFFAVIFISNQVVISQDSAGVRQEGWPEINVFYKFNENIRVYAAYSATRLRTSNFTDGGAGVYVDYFANTALRKKFRHELWDSTKGYYLWFRAGYYYSATAPGSKNPVTENTMVSEANSRFHLPADYLLTVKTRFDWRFINGEFKTRYRPRVTLDKDFKTEYLFFNGYFYGEYFVNFNASSSNRFRLCFGIDLRVTKLMNLETYYLYQFRNGEDVDAVNAIGFVLKVYLDRQLIKDIF